MQIEEFFGVVALLAFLGLLIFIPVRFFMLIGEVKALEKRVQALAERTPVEAVKPVGVAVPAADVDQLAVVVSHAPVNVPNPVVAPLRSK